MTPNKMDDQHTLEVAHMEAKIKQDSYYILMYTFLNLILFDIAFLIYYRI